MNVRALLVSVGLGLGTLILIAVLGSFTAVKIIVIMGLWFALLGVVALGFETLTQFVSRAIRGRR